MKGICENEKCGKFGETHINQKTGKRICEACHKKDSRYHKVCSKCKKKKRISLHLNNTLLCNDCYITVWGKAVCVNCQKMKGVYTRNALGEPICRICFQNNPSNHKICSSCQNLKFPYAYDAKGNPICKNCKNNDPDNQKICFCCNEKRRVYAHDISGNPVCSRRKCRKKAELLKTSLATV